MKMGNGEIIFAGHFVGPLSFADEITKVAHSLQLFYMSVGPVYSSILRVSAQQKGALQTELVRSGGISGELGRAMVYFTQLKATMV